MGHQAKSLLRCAVLLLVSVGSAPQGDLKSLGCKAVRVRVPPRALSLMTALGHPWPRHSLLASGHPDSTRPRRLSISDWCQLDLGRTILQVLARVAVRHGAQENHNEMVPL